MPRISLLLVCTVATCVTALPAQAVATTAAAGSPHWNQWRGPSRTGQYTGPAWPETLTEKNVEQQWQIELGESYSGPVVDAERIYTTATVDEYSEHVWALDRKTGEKVWEASWEGAMKVPFFAARNGSWIRSTPALDDGRLYVAGMLDVLVCLDAKSGKEIWKVDFKDVYGTPKEPFGFVCSPLVRGDAVYVQTAAGLIKLDKTTGKPLWRGLDDSGKNMMSAGAFSSPVWTEIQGVEQLVVQGRTRLHGVDPMTGKELWGINIRSFRGMNILTPTPYKQGVFTSAYGGRAHYFAVSTNEGEFGVEEKWNNRAQGNMTSPVIIDGHAYLYLRSKRFACVDLEAGEAAWISSPLGDTYWSLVANGNRILALTDAGELLLLKANPEKLEVLNTLEVTEEETWAHLAVDHGQLFVRGLHTLTAFSWE
ncbi:MAG: PQQ-like beta-propeller repeat protein [bacterium]|nr:PQQ-like beta-propeller repeat protein [bacterium]